MTHKLNLLAGAAAVLAFGLPAGAFAADPPPHIATAIGSFARPMVDKTRDAELKPGDVLTFAEVKAGGAVVDLVPGDGYWTRLLAKSVGPQGHVYSVVPIRGYRNLGAQRNAEAAAAKADGKPAPVNGIDLIQAIMVTASYKNVMGISESIDWYGGNFGIPQQADVVFTSNAYHDFHNKVTGDYQPGPFDMNAINKAIFRAMKPGAAYVISDYAAAPGAGFGATESLKRADPEAVKTELAAAGFQFVGASDALANPADDHNTPADPANKPDRFILKFRKPANTPATDKRPPANWIARWEGNTFTLGAPDPDTFGSGLYYHADGTVEETGGNPNAAVALGTWYFDADGHNCQYHENNPLSNLGFVVCHPFGDAALNAKPGDSWQEMGGTVGANPNTVGMLKGQVYAKPRAGRGGGAAPAGAPGAAPGGMPGAAPGGGRGGPGRMGGGPPAGLAQ